MLVSVFVSCDFPDKIKSNGGIGNGSIVRYSYHLSYNLQLEIREYEGVDNII
ncbi:hypothetical protein KsCSTR_27420 [Candidatus Kuenenia stuttgartiensis]|uniref:Uncharacterized protein n=1 Tax=Kuenenia stuttgartiensis TaxID=174633 RepID=A0A6G7GRQ2_KUEST|nr:hypothetical protein KsCSTR_27420 [Candidatus Kuenenia stuttgartiensis]